MECLLFSDLRIISLDIYIYISSKVDLLKKQIADLNAQLEVEIAKNTNVSHGTLPIRIGKKKP